MNGKGIARFMRDERGSALVSSFIVIVVLLILGLGILTLSTANIVQARKADTYERDYYAANGGARQGVETLKSAALEQYRKIAEDLKNNIHSSNNAMSFFAALDAVTCDPPQPDSSAGGPSTLTVTITHGTVDSDTHRYSVLSTATDGRTPRSILGSIDINFVPVTLTAGFVPLGDEAVITGGKPVQNSGNTSITGSVRFGALHTPPYRQWNFSLNGVVNPDLAPYVDPDTASALNWDMDYPGFTKEPKTNVPPTLPPIANGTTITNASFKDPPFNWTVPSPIYLEGQPGASFTVSSQLGTYSGGQIYCTGSLTDSAPIEGAAGNYVKIYSTGVFTQSSGMLNYVKVFCDGNINLNSGPAVKNSYIYSHGSVSISGRDLSNLVIKCDGNLTISGGGMNNVTIYCGGAITDGSNDKTNVKIYCQSYAMSGGNFIGDNIVYAENSIYLESTVSGLFYSNGYINVGTGAGLTGGQVVAKENLNINGSFNFRYDAAMLERLNVDPFTTSTGGGATAIVQPADPQIFASQPSYAEQ